MTLYVLDSDHLSLHQRGYESLKPHLLIVPPEQLSITIISVEELIRGRLAQVRRALQPEDRVTAYVWLSKTFDFLNGFQGLNYDATAESHFQSLLAQKLRIGTQDLKIAAIVLSQNAILVTRNYRDFEKIPQLRMTNWASG
jgi:tRNA(fMet)-specific endonuclease VapC